MAVRANGLSPLSNAVRRFPGQYGSDRAVRGQPVLELVREALVVRLLTNPIFMRAALVLFAAGTAFVVAICLMRLLRQGIAAAPDLNSRAAPKLGALPLQLDTAIIHQLNHRTHS